jgi:LysR family transcriptional regulator, glycine cleavage system transcriptional activator
MHKTLRQLPSLDFLKGFEAAGRLLSFTRAADELFVTQSALSRQVQALEAALGVPLFERRHRALSLTAAGAAFHHEIAAALASVAAAAERLGNEDRKPAVTLTTTVSFASLWIVPRLPAFRTLHPEVEVYVSANDRTVDLGRGDVDLAIRYCAEQTAPPGSVRLFGERMLPVVSPLVARDPRTPLKRPADLARHVLLHLDDPENRTPWLDWRSWLAANGEPGLKPAGSLRFTLYDQVIQAAVGGQGVALGRLPMIAGLLREGRLVAPFPKKFDSARGYYVLVAPHARGRPDVEAFVAWLGAEAAAAAIEPVAPRPVSRSAPAAAKGGRARRAPVR